MQLSTLYVGWLYILGIRARGDQVLDEVCSLEGEWLNLLVCLVWVSRFVSTLGFEEFNLKLMLQYLWLVGFEHTHVFGPSRSSEKEPAYCSSIKIIVLLILFVTNL